MTAPNLQSPNDEDVTRSLPHAVGPEKSVLSSMLQEPVKYVGLAIETGLTESHFYLPQHAMLFNELCKLSVDGEEIELVSLIQKLLDRGKLERIGGPAYLTELYTYSPTPAHFAAHAKLLQDKRIARGIIQGCNEAISNIYDEPEAVTSHLDLLESQLTGLRENRQGNTIVTARQAVKAVLDRLKGQIAGTEEVRGLMTGFTELDRLGRMKPGDMFILAARPSMGKTSLMMNIVENVCIDQNQPTLVFSAEMTWEQLTERLLYSRAKFTASQLLNGHRPTKGDLQRIQQAAQAIAESNLFTDDTAGISIEELRAKARRYKREQDIRFIAIDYLQLMKSRSKQARDSREREIAEISSGIKGLAKELGVPILVLAQLNRGPESRSGDKLGVPRMSDLRESGSIEQDADMVGLLYRKAYYATGQQEKDAVEGEAMLSLAKNRNGETGDVPLTWIAPLMRFESGEPVKESNHSHETPALQSRFDD